MLRDSLDSKSVGTIHTHTHTPFFTEKLCFILTDSEQVNCFALRKSEIRMREKPDTLVADSNTLSLGSLSRSTMQSFIKLNRKNRKLNLTTRKSTLPETLSVYPWSMVGENVYQMDQRLSLFNELHILARFAVSNTNHCK